MNKGHILFLEDQDIIREVLTEYLEMDGYSVFQAVDGVEALIALKEESFDLAILDIMVPKITGLDLLDVIEEMGLSLGKIVLTALGDDETQIEAFSRKADDFISKPVNPQILLKRVETVLRRVRYSKDTSKANINKHGLYLNDKSYKVFYDNKDLGLTLSEFLLLQALVNSPEQVFTRDQLINIIFDEDYICNDRVIDSHVKNIRKKLPINCIKTVVGLGYSYENETI